MKTLQALGWNWRTDGVEVCALVDGQRYQMFVPLARVWHEFAKSFAEDGTPLPAAVGAELTVSGLFEGIAHVSRQPAVGWFGSSLAKSVAKAATAVTKVALTPVAAIAKPAVSVINSANKQLASVPVFGSALAAATTALTSPVSAVNALAQGGKINNVAMNALKSNISSIRTLAPYAQTVISVVPGVGQGLSGAIGAGLALASGMSITQAVEAGVRDSLPGGPLAKAAFDVAAAAAQGKPVSQIALAALPITASQKQWLVQGVSLAQDLAKGKNVSHAVIDAALTGLPPEAAKAVQIASALAHAKNLQQVVGGVAQAANVSNALGAGMRAAQQITARPPSLPTPPALLSAVKQGLAAKQLVASAQQAAAQGHAPSALFLSWLAKPKISGPLETNFQARYHTNHAHPHHGAGVHRGGIHQRHSVGAPQPMKTFTARFHTEGPSVSGPFGIHRRFRHVGAPMWGSVFQHMTHAPAQHRALFPVRMPYQMPAVLRHAYGR